ncbi:MAG: AAA domain-containing protein [Tannerellaceae bacterium]|nr:AAA domain-containing protein [Tannerellaceae bacterium]
MPKDTIGNPFAELQHQYELLQMEYAFEKESYQQQTERAGIWKKIQQGVCWHPVMQGKSYYNSLDQLVIEIERREHKETEHTFEHGRPVCFFTSDSSGKLTYLNFPATISYVEEDRMVVVLPSSGALFELQQAYNPGVQLYFDETSYKTMFQGLSQVMQAKNNRLAQLRDTLLGKAPAGFRNLSPVRFPWLNPSQEAAVNRVLAAKEVHVVHGPPGTGKTTTLVEAVYETLHRENQVMICAQSNIAVDWIAEKLTDRGVPVLRIGNPTRVNDKMLSFTYERLFEAHPAYPELWGIRKAIRETQTSLRRKSREEKDTIRNRLSRLRFRATELEIQMDTDLFNEARVIACTLIGSANRVLMNRHFTTLFMDEAAQALEAACWVAITKADRVILAGDHQQLPPTIKCLEAAKGGLDHTLMQKIAGRKPEVVSLLTIQYRMHEDIMRFPSRYFYRNQLIAAPEVKNRGILEYDTPIIWLDTAGCHFEESRQTESMSRINKQEALLTVLQLQVYMEKIGKERVLEERIDFGVISPYKAQVHYLRRLVRQEPFFKPYRKLIAIHTVDGFQGQERDVILISLVRANEAGQIGFLTDLRRMNVAMTRAKMKLIMIGDGETLTVHRFYKELYQYVTKYGRIIPVSPN